LTAAWANVPILGMALLCSLGLHPDLIPTACAADAVAIPRVEARSADILAVGVVHGDAMTIHLSRVLDNAPLHDAAVTLTLRGTAHPAIAEADGSYTVHTPDLALPGSAAVVFTIGQANAEQRLTGTLQIPGTSNDSPNGAARQYGWWALNFGVCIGFLYLWSRRKKSDD
jgi:hypothetical protein